MWSYFLKAYQQTVRSILRLLSVHYHLSHLPPFRLVTSSHIRFASSAHSVPTPNSIEAVRFDKGWLHPRGENILHEESLAHYRLLWKSGISVRPPAFVLLSCGLPGGEQDPVAYMHGSNTRNIYCCSALNRLVTEF